MVSGASAGAAAVSPTLLEVEGNVCFSYRMCLLFLSYVLTLSSSAAARVDRALILNRFMLNAPRSVSFYWQKNAKRLFASAEAIFTCLN
jgi:hypothetical protein